MKKALSLLPVIVGISFLFLLAYPSRERALHGANDFVSFYAGAKLAGTPDLYSRPANLALIQSILGFRMEGTTYIRAPFYAVLLKPLAALPYRTAWAIFFTFLLGSILWFVLRFSKECPALPTFAALSVPLLTPLLNGQDTPFLLVMIGAAILLLRRERDFEAGLVLSLCALKPHLFIYLALLLLIRKRWGAILGGIAGASALGLLGLGAGIAANRSWINALRDPWISPDPQNLPNLHGLILTLHGNGWIEAITAVIFALIYVFCALKCDNFELLFAMALVCGLLTSFHSGPADDVLLLPVFVLTVAASTNTAVRSITALILTPVPFLMGLAGSPYSAALPVLLAIWFVAATLSITWPARKLVLGPAV